MNSVSILWMLHEYGFPLLFYGCFICSRVHATVQVFSLRIQLRLSFVELRLNCVELRHCFFELPICWPLSSLRWALSLLCRASSRLCRASSLFCRALSPFCRGSSLFHRASYLFFDLCLRFIKRLCFVELSLSFEFRQLCLYFARSVSPLLSFVSYRAWSLFCRPLHLFFRPLSLFCRPFSSFRRYSSLFCWASSLFCRALSLFWKFRHSLQNFNSCLSVSLFPFGWHAFCFVWLQPVVLLVSK